MTVATICVTLPSHPGRGVPPEDGDGGDDVVLHLRRGLGGVGGGEDDGGGGGEVVLSRRDVIRAAAASADREGMGRARFFRTEDGSDGAYVRCRALTTPLPVPKRTSGGRRWGGNDGCDGGGTRGGGGRPLSILPGSDGSFRVPTTTVILMTVPTALLLSFAASCLLCGASGYEAVFPSASTWGIAAKVTTWLSLGVVVAYEHAWFWHDPRLYVRGSGDVTTVVRVTVEGWASDADGRGGRGSSVASGKVTNGGRGSDARRILRRESDLGENVSEHERLTQSSRGFEIELSPKTKHKSPSKNGMDPPRDAAEENPAATEEKPAEATEERSDGGEAGASVVSARDVVGENGSPNDKGIRSVASSGSLQAPATQQLPPPRFIKAEKGDILAAQRRYQETLAWREEMGMDNILSEPHPNFAVIKRNYPHFYHLRGRNNEPCYYESPPKMKLAALKAAGLTMDDLLRHYAITCEFMWTHIEPSEDGKSVYVIDLAGIGIRDFAGDVVDFVKRTSAFTAAHYPERSGSIFVINVPSWFSIIWNTVKPWVDEVTREKISILRSGGAAITKALEEKVPIENIPPEYGGKSMPLGQSPEEVMFREKMEQNNRRYQAEKDGIQQDR